MASSARNYSDPHGTYTAAAAPLWRRGLAGAVDWILAGVAYLIALIVAGIVQAVAGVAGDVPGTVAFWITETAALGVIVAYFAGLLASGHTLGMRALDIHVRAFADGRPPRLTRTVPRSLLGLAFATAALNAYSYVSGTPALAEFTTFQETVGRVAIGVVAVAAAGQAWMLVDREGRTVWDRLTGLVVVEDIMPASLPGRLWSPWGT